MDDSKDMGDAERKLSASVAAKTGVDEASVAKVLGHLGLSGALKNRVSKGGKLDPDALNLRIAAGQVMQ